MKKDEVLRFLREYKREFEPIFLEFMEERLGKVGELGGDIARAVEELVEISQGGKRLRGGLQMLGHLISGGEWDEQALRASIFSEVFHLGLLVQDDVMDQDEKRRGKNTIHSLFQDLHYGEAMAVCAGDLCFAWAMEVLVESGYGQEKILGSLKEYARYFEGVVLGQMRDVENAEKSELVGEKEVFQVMKMKTAEYMGVLPLVVGARLAGERDEEKLNLLREYGLHLGLAFQIQDDVLGIFGEEIGKPVGSDMREGKSTLLTTYLLENGTNKQKEVFRSVWGKREISEKEVERVRGVFKEVGADVFARKRAEEHVKKGRVLVKEITEDRKLRSVLFKLLNYMIEREI